jgi:hypothetical protein
MADEILIKVRADVDGFKADMDEAKKIGNSAIAEIEKKELKIEPKIETKSIESQFNGVGSTIRNKFSEITNGVSDQLTTLGTNARAAFTSMRAAGVSSFRAIAGAIAATGIGALVVAVGVIAANWDKIKGYVNGVSSAQKSLNDLAQKNLEIQRQKTKELNSQDNTLKLQGKSEKEIRQIKLDQLNYQIKIQEIALRTAIETANAQYKAEVRNKRILASALSFISVPLILLLKTIDSIGSRFGQQFNLVSEFTDKLSSFVFDPAELKAEKDKEIGELKQGLIELKNTRDGLILDSKKKEKDSSKEVKEAKEKDFKDYSNTVKTGTEDLITTSKEYADEEEKFDKEEEQRAKDIFAQWKEQAEEKARIQKENEDARVKYETDLLNRQKQAFDELLQFAGNGILLSIGLNPQDVARLTESISRIADQIRSGGKVDAGEVAQVAGNAYFAVSNAIAANDAQKRQEELTALQSQQEEELRLAGDNEQKKEIIRQKYALKEKEIKRKQAESDKKKAIMDATINTAVAVAKTFANLGFPLGIVPAAIVGALGAAQIALIAATPIPKFAKGGAVPSSDIQGMINGRPHSAGGVLIEAEGNEFLVNKAQAIKKDNRGLLEAVNMSDSERDAYINRHYVMPALQAKESKANEIYRHSVIEAENNLIARVSSHTLKSIHREQRNTTEAIKRLDKKDYKW